MFKLNKDNIPNLLTYGRIGTIPLFVLFFYLPGAVGAWLSCLLFIGASITDWLDGYYARKYQVVSDKGRFLDPIADKLLVVVALVLLVEAGIVGAVVVALILCREIWVSGLREYLGQKNVVVPVSTLAKWKTAVQMGAITLLLLAKADYAKADILGTLALWVACGLTLYTGYLYTKAAWEKF